MLQRKAYKSILIGENWERLTFNELLLYLYDCFNFTPAKKCCYYIVCTFVSAEKAAKVLRELGVVSPIFVKYIGVFAEKPDDDSCKMMLFGSTDRSFYPKMLENMKESVEKPRIEFLANKIPEIGWDGFGRFGGPLQNDIYSEDIEINDKKKKRKKN
jgi:hypothetical protein